MLTLLDWYCYPVALGGILGLELLSGLLGGGVDALLVAVDAVVPPAPAGPAGELGVVPGAAACGAPLSPFAEPTNAFVLLPAAGAVAAGAGAGFAVAVLVGGVAGAAVNCCVILLTAAVAPDRKDDAFAFDVLAVRPPNVMRV